MWTGNAHTDTTTLNDARPMLDRPSEYINEIILFKRDLARRGRTERTVENKRKTLMATLNFLNRSKRHCSAFTITEEDVRYIVERMDVKESTKRMYLSDLGQFIQFHTGRNIVNETEILWNRANYKRLFIDRETVIEAIKVSEPRVRLCLMLGAFMGLRTVEMQRLKVEDIHGNVMTVRGKGHNNGLECEQIIPSIVREELDSYLLWRSHQPYRDMTEGHVLFTIRGNAIKGIREGSATIYKWITESGEKVGKEITPHSLRRLFATTLYYELHIDIVTIRELMRHSDVKTTLQNYIQAYDEKKIEAMSKLNDLYSTLYPHNNKRGV